MIDCKFCTFMKKQKGVKFQKTFLCFKYQADVLKEILEWIVKNR